MHTCSVLGCYEGGGRREEGRRDGQGDEVMWDGTSGTEWELGLVTWLRGGGSCLCGGAVRFGCLVGCGLGRRGRRGWRRMLEVGVGVGVVVGGGWVAWLRRGMGVGVVVVEVVDIGAVEDGAAGAAGAAVVMVCGRG